MPTDWLKRLQSRERSRRYRAAHPDRVRGQNRRAREEGRQAKSKAKADPNRDRDRRAEKYFRLNKNAGIEGGLNRQQLERPTLFFLDKNGVLHREDYRSAEEVIADETHREEKPCPS